MLNPYVDGARRAFVPFVVDIDGSTEREALAMRRAPRSKRLPARRPRRSWIVS